MKKSRRIKNVPAEKRGLRYPLDFVAAELGVDAETLKRRCEDASYSINGAGLKFSEAYDALSLKSVSEAARRRKNLAEAEASEIDTLNKKKMFVLKLDHESIVKDLAVSIRVVIESVRYIPVESRRKLIKELAEIKPGTAPASHK